MTAKAHLRSDVKRRLSEAAVDLLDAWSRTIEQRVLALPEVQSAGCILLYASTNGEASTDEIARQARNRGIGVAYPRCPPDALEMTLHLIHEHSDLASLGRFGIREPRPGAPEVAIEAIDVCFLPGLAWDRRGHRLGRGAGYYDRLLANPRWRAVRCGLFFSLQEVARIPEDPWDRPLDLVVTERELVRFDR